MIRVRPVVLAALLSVAAILSPSPAHAWQQAASDVVLDLRPPDEAAPGDPVTTLEQRGSAEVDIALATLDGGSARWAEEPGRGLVVDLPEATSDEVVPRAVLAVPDPDAADGTVERDAFSPGYRPFSFGADFRTSMVRMGRYDDGDNVMQRGLASDESQYKLEISGGRVACVLIGSSGELRIHVGQPVDPRSWYSARCTRMGEAAVLWVAEHRQDGTVEILSRTKRGPIGSIAWSSKNPPLSIGGKLTAAGTVMRSTTDQLNGDVANPVLVLRSALAPKCGSATCLYAVVA